jgi:hypothetical protein
MELSRPTVRGNTAWGNRTVSRTGSTGMRRRLVAEMLLSEGCDDGMIGFWLDIECPLINFSYIRERSIAKVAEIWP